MNRKTRIISYTIAALALLLAFTGRAQVLSNQVLNAGGDHRQSAQLGISITDNIGEVVVESLGPMGQLMITQGFLQPEVNSGFTILKNDPTCVSREDGFISVIYNTLHAQHQEQYIWSPNVSCPPAGCGNRAANLGPGTYSVMIISTYTAGGSQVLTDTLRRTGIVISEALEPCRVVVYSGVTPNGDGVNDTWRIENISEFPGNHVSVYNRWGVQLFDTRNYDNDNNFWPKPEILNTLVSSTYFYVIELGDNSKPLKGWIELLKN
jgi:gliding motility-associated-like protein